MGGLLGLLDSSLEKEKNHELQIQGENCLKGIGRWRTIEQNTKQGYLRASAPAHVCGHTLPHTQTGKPLTIKEVADQLEYLQSIVVF